MKINTNQVLRTIDGQTMKDTDSSGNAVDATVKSAIVNCILSPVQKETGVEKVAKYELAKRIYASDEVDLNEKEITLIKDRVGELYSPVVVGQLYELLHV